MEAPPPNAFDEERRLRRARRREIREKLDELELELALQKKKRLQAENEKEKAAKEIPPEKGQTPPQSIASGQPDMIPAIVGTAVGLVVLFLVSFFIYKKRNSRKANHSSTVVEPPQHKAIDIEPTLPTMPNRISMNESIVFRE